MKKICLRCGKEKPLSQFYKHNRMKDGYLNICKKCVKKRVAKYREENIEEIRAYNRFRRRPENMTTEQKEKIRIYKKNWRARDKRRTRAHNFVKRKLKSKRPNICQICGKKTRIVAHHNNYNEPSKVIWCCSACHSNLHKQSKIAINRLKNITPSLPFEG